MRMKVEEENKFDFQIRSVLGDATEEVPEKVWLGIERRLDGKGQAGKKTVVLPFWMKVACGVAAAAAIAAVMFLSGTFDGAVSQRQYDNLADAGEEDRIGIVEPHTYKSGPDPVAETAGPAESKKSDPAEQAEKPAGPVDKVLIADAVIPSDTSVDIVEENNEEAEEIRVTEDGNVPETKDKEAAAETGTGETGTEETAGETNSDKARWERLLREESERGRYRARASLTLSGNAVSNTNSSVSMDATPPSFRPGKNELTEDKISEASESSYSVPVSFGVGVKVDFARRWAVSAGINYSLLGRNFAGTFFDVKDDGSYTETYFSDIRNRQDYIGIPVNVYFSILKSDIIDFYAYAGGAAEKCVSNRYLMNADGFDINHREKVRGMQFSANVGLGMEFIIADTFGIYIDPSLRYYFPDEDQPHSIRTSQPLMFGLELGFRVHL